tara:strand:- start:194 stop:418 length:225 start_codon:yes stop_codon:yes gene_type:complete
VEIGEKVGPINEYGKFIIFSNFNKETGVSTLLTDDRLAGRYSSGQPVDSGRDASQRTADFTEITGERDLLREGQ